MVKLKELIIFSVQGLTCTTFSVRGFVMAPSMLMLETLLASLPPLAIHWLLWVIQCVSV